MNPITFFRKWLKYKAECKKITSFLERNDNDFNKKYFLEVGWYIEIKYEPFKICERVYVGSITGQDMYTADECTKIENKIKKQIHDSIFNR
jgi:hypothetical protein